MFGFSYKIAKIMGIPIRIHITLIILLVAIAVLTWKGSESPSFDVPFILLLVIAVFASIALHELGHSFVARRKGCRVREITLMFIGGVARMDRMPKRPRDEIQLAIAGPLVSLSLAAILGGVWAYFYGVKIDLYVEDPSLSLLFRIWLIKYFGTPIELFILMLGKTNAFLAVFNLIPAFPMDGGRILRAALTPKLGRLRATLIAARIGKLVAICFVLLAVFRGRLGEFGQFITPWVLIPIALFIYYTGSREYRMVRMQEMAKHGPQSPWEAFMQMMNRDFEASPPEDYDDGDDDDEDKVIISPPPYEKDGKESKTDIHTSRDNPFRSNF